MNENNLLKKVTEIVSKNMDGSYGLHIQLIEGKIETLRVVRLIPEISEQPSATIEQENQKKLISYIG